MFEVGKVYVGTVGCGCGYDHYEKAHYIKVTKVSKYNVWFRTCSITTIYQGKIFRDERNPKSLGYIHKKALTEGKIIRRKLHHGEFGDYIYINKDCSIYAYAINEIEEEN